MSAIPALVQFRLHGELLCQCPMRIARTNNVPETIAFTPDEFVLVRGERIRFATTGHILVVDRGPSENHKSKNPTREERKKTHNSQQTLPVTNSSTASIARSSLELLLCPR